ncbi:hypothetical protein PT974_09703 [Cladobotryum mycophilum]|uniref:Uncharacterized protein n=1 Tax=Cladobotryum mycophilum TaxID=491253 RepID=A0ABR0SH01_9HYPO
MGISKLENFFIDAEYTKRTTEWARHVRDHQEDYADCRIASFTRFKNLRSEWNHEYVQFVVEDATTEKRTSVCAQRVLDEWGDYVTLGTVGETETGSKDETGIPLPLTSLLFGGPSGKDNEQRPHVLLLTEILSATTVTCGKHSVFDTNSFWFSITSYDALKRYTGKWAQEKVWRWFDAGGASSEGFRDAIGLGWTTIFKWGYVGADGSPQLFGAPLVVEVEDDDGGVIIDKLKKATGIAFVLERDDNMNEYVGALKDRCIDLDKAEVQKHLQAMQEKDAKVDVYDNLIINTELQKCFAQEVLSDSDAPKHLEYYQKIQVPLDMDWGESKEALRAELEAMTIRALHVTVGSILAQVNT